MSEENLAIRIIEAAAELGPDTETRESSLQLLNLVEGGHGRHFVLKHLLEELAAQFVLLLDSADLNNRHLLEELFDKVCEQLKDRLTSTDLKVHAATALRILILHYSGQHDRRTGEDLSVVRSAIASTVVAAINSPATPQ